MIKNINNITNIKIPDIDIIVLLSIHIPITTPIMDNTIMIYNIISNIVVCCKFIIIKLFQMFRHYSLYVYRINNNRATIKNNWRKFHFVQKLLQVHYHPFRIIHRASSTSQSQYNAHLQRHLYLLNRTHKFLYQSLH